MQLRRPLARSVVVVTGASGGIGAATARAVAAEGAAVVLAARREDALRTVADRCVAVASLGDRSGAAGGRALAVPTDVTDPAAVTALAAAARDRFGRIDAWVNNAGVGLYAALADAPLDEVRRV